MKSIARRLVKAGHPDLAREVKAAMTNNLRDLAKDYPKVGRYVNDMGKAVKDYRVAFRKLEDGFSEVIDVLEVLSKEAAHSGSELANDPSMKEYKKAFYDLNKWAADLVRSTQSAEKELLSDLRDLTNDPIMTRLPSL